jgi:hypothetical protein
LTTTKPAEAGTPVSRWSLDDLALRILQDARYRDISRSTIQRILAEAELKSHKVRSWMHAEDPDFEKQALAICRLYLTSADLLVRTPEERRRTSADLLVRTPEEAAHVGDAVRGAHRADAPVAGQLRHVVRLHRPAEADLAQRLHHAVHVQVAVVQERLNEVRQRRADVAEVHVEAAVMR